MIFESLELVRKNLDLYLKGGTTANNQPDLIVLGNIAFATPDNSTTNATDESAQIYMSMVNVEEEFTFKNQSAVRPSLTNTNGVEYIHPPFHLNLYVLFTANHKKYTDALQAISKLLNFFQANRVFSMANSPVPGEGIFLDNKDVERIRVRFDLISLTFEQINHLWGSLGGKQMPFVLFKMSKIEIDAQKTLEGGGLIQEIEINSKG